MQQTVSNVANLTDYSFYKKTMYFVLMKDNLPMYITTEYETAMYWKAMEGQWYEEIEGM